MVNFHVCMLLLLLEYAIKDCNISLGEPFEGDFEHVFCVIFNIAVRSMSFVYFLMSLVNYGFDKMLSYWFSHTLILWYSDRVVGNALKLFMWLTFFFGH